jgi:hypothetical protein
MGGRQMTFESIRRLLGVRSAIIQTQIYLAKILLVYLAILALLSAAKKKWLENLIGTRFKERKPITYVKVLDSLYYDRQVAITPDKPWHIIRNMESVKTIIGQPMEAERVAVDPDAISVWFERLNSMVDGVPRELFFNMDETYCCDHSDGREVRVILPIDYREPSLPVPSDRHSKRSTFVACIAADGCRMKPFAIVDRVTIEKDLQYYGYDASKVTLASQTNAFMATALFELWATTVFFPTIEQRRTDLAYDGRVMLLMNGLGFHYTDYFLVECKTRQIDVLFLIPRASDEIQPLDLLTFAIME